VRVAALYDVHGNLPALEAVLREAETAADVFVLGGDLVWGPWPRETLQRAEELGERARFLRGNCETLILEQAGEHRWAYERLGDDQRAKLALWPLTLSLDIDGLGPALFCHATPRSDEEILTPESAEERWREACSDVVERTIVCGHTHLQFDSARAGRRIVNPGSVGAPTVRAAAWWALLGPDVQLRATEYDSEATISAAGTLGLPDVGRFARWLREPPSYDDRVAVLVGPA
jgi:predicted phosphodiesterase